MAGLVVDGYRIDLFLLWVVVVDLTVLLMDLGRIAKLVDAWVVVYLIVVMELASVRLSPWWLVTKRMMIQDFQNMLDVV